MQKSDKTEPKKLRLVFGDATLGVYAGPLFLLFSYARGGMESLVKDGVEWLYRTPQPAFWRAVTDNDRGNGFCHRAAMWMGADAFIRCISGSVKVDHKECALPVAPENNRYMGEQEAETVTIRFTYETNTVPVTEVTVTYEVHAAGEVRVEVHYQGKEGLPELPAFGLRFIMPTKAERFRYEGLSGETYPDRMAGGVPGVYETKGLPVTRYLVPQDCGMHMRTKWVTIYRKSSLTFEADSGDFAFSCLPYTPLELENATHQEELPPARRTVLTLYGAVRGVGGIDSWGADVEPAYKIPADRDIRLSFRIRP